MNSRGQSYIIYALLFIAIIAMVYFNMNQQTAKQETLTLNQLAADIQPGQGIAYSDRVG